MSIAVVFLWRGRDGGGDSGAAFFESYRVHPAHRAHDLVVLAKGWPDAGGLAAARRQAREMDARFIELPDEGFDFAAYFRAARRLEHDWVCLLNTHSRIGAEGWLDKLQDAADGPGIGAAAATGSWGTMVPRASGPGVTLPGLAVLPLRFAARIRRFPRFPNPHLRSNALMLRRDLLLEFAAQAALPVRKTDAHHLESGRAGFSRFLRSRLLRPVVVGADGAHFEAPDWLASGTFRVPGQPNLLISDNQTRNYEAADRRMRRILEFSAWGTTLTP